MLLIPAGVVAAAVTLPLALWNWHAFWFSTVTVQQKSAVPLGCTELSGVPGVTRLAIYRMDLAGDRGADSRHRPCALRALRNVTGFAAALGLAFLVFFAFNKQAFCNYYFFTIGCFVCAASLARCPKCPNP